MAAYRKKPVVIEAIRYEGVPDVVFAWLGQWHPGKTWTLNLNDALVIPTLEGPHFADVGDWIIRGVKGEFYPCKPDIFEQTYEPA